MKCVSLRAKRAHKQSKVNNPTRATHEPFANASAAPHEIHTYEQLRQQIHGDLRLQHPEWIQPDGESPMCDSYEARLMDLLDHLARQEPTHPILNSHRLLEQGAH
jgi:hypothetical protein